MATVAYSVVAAPTVTPYRFGLFSVAEIRTAALAAGGLDEHWRLGVTWETEACDQVGITVNPCVFEQPAPLESDRFCNIAEFKPFTLYAYSRGSVVGKTLEMQRADAVAKLQNGEQYGAESALWGLLNAATPVPENLTALPGWLGLGWMEQALAERYGSQGVIHMNRSAATALGLYVKPDGAMMRTVLGTPVVVGGGYDQLSDPAVDTAVIYGTGPVIMYRSEIDTQADAVNTSINDVSIVAQRDYVVGWDCVTLAAEITLGCPAPAG